MKIKNKSLIMLFVTLTVWLIVSQQVQCAFKDSGWGARPLGMGGAFTAVADDSNAQLYNPAGITQVEYIETNYMYAKLFTSLDKVNLGLNYGSVVFPLNDRFSLGLLWANFVSENQYREDTLALTGAYKVLCNLSVGVNLKNLSHGYVLDKRTVNDIVFSNGASRSNYAIDAGVFYKGIEKEKYDVSFGVSGKNINRPDMGLKSLDFVPPELRAGIRFDVKGKIRIMPAIDYSYRCQEWGEDMDKMNINAGCEVKILNEVLALRAGANVSEITAGFGVRPVIKKLVLQLDYAFIMPLLVKDTNGSHRVSLILRFLKVS